MGIEEHEVVIVGAGIAGVATALALHRVGVRSLVLERFHELRTTGSALSLFPNAWVALHTLGVAHKLSSIYSPFKNGYYTDLENGSVQQVPFNRKLEENSDYGARTVHRKTLLEALANELPNDTIRYSAKLSSIESCTHEGSLVSVLHMGDGTIIRAKVLIGCDGVHSVVARWLGLSKPVHYGRFAVRGLAIMPQDHGLNNEVHQFIHGECRSGFVHLTAKEAYWFVTYTSTDNEGEEKRARDPELLQKKILENSANFPPRFLEFVRHSDLSTLSWAPLVLRLPWSLIFGHISKGNVVVAGDAMHPMTPDLAQGGCSALEDAVVLGRHIGNSYLKHKRIISTEVAEALKMYVKERRWRAIWLITGSYLSGWVQQGGSGWLRTFIREKVSYRSLFQRIADIINYDCGKLACVSPVMEVNNNHTKID